MEGLGEGVPLGEVGWDGSAGGLHWLVDVAGGASSGSLVVFEGGGGGSEVFGVEHGGEGGDGGGGLVAERGAVAGEDGAVVGGLLRGRAQSLRWASV